MIAAVLLTLLGQCEVRAEWLPDQELLRLGDGTPFGSIDASDCAGSIGPRAFAQWKPDGGVSLETRQFGIELQLVAPDVAVTLDEPADFGEGFTSGPRTKLDVVGIDGTAALLTPHERQDVEFLGKWRPRRVQCDRLKLGSSKRVRRDGFVLSTSSVISARKAGSPSFRVPAGLQFRREGKTHVVILLEDGATIDGWPASRMKGEVMGGWSDTFCTGCSFLRQAPRSCVDPLPLSVRRGERVERIGTMDAGTQFDVVSSDGKYLVISPRAQYFRLSEWWELVVAQSDLEKCSQLPIEAGAPPIAPQHLER
ncbi:MAG: hypothetical protein Q8L48_20495 [Archangium sp.]|nr:hypothetical protein [Archangium sp.]